MTASETLTALGSWIRSAVPTVETTETVDIDTYVSVSTTQYLDLGIAGEVEVDVEVDEYNVEISDYEVEVSVEVDVEDLIRVEAPVSLDDLYAALESAVDALDAGGSAVLPTAIDTTESTAARAALAAVRSFLDGYGSDAVIRSLGSALTLAGYGSSEPPADVVDAMRSLIDSAVEVERVERVETVDLRPGDVLVESTSGLGGSDLDRAKGSTVVSVVQTGSDTGLRLVTFDSPDYGRDSARFNFNRQWTVERSTSTSTLGYDPRTVPLSTVELSCKVLDLRLGDDITGSTFGRVVGVERSGSGLVLVLDRDGRENRLETSDETSWRILPISPDYLDRSTIPTALDALGVAQSV